MDLTQLSNLGEFIGGIGVLATLVYLAIQVHQTKEFVRLESAQSTTKDFQGLLIRMMDKDHMKLFRKGLNDFESMPKNDQARLHHLLFSGLMIGQSTYALGRRGAAEERIEQMVHIPNAAILRCPGIAQWWSSAKVAFPNDFVQYMDNQVASQSDTPFFYENLPWYAWDEDSDVESTGE